MKILFIQRVLGQEMMGIMYLSRALKDAGADCKALFVPTEQNVLKYVIEHKPDLLCYGTTTGLHRYYMDINKTIKKHYSAFSIFGGPYPSFVPEMLEDEDIDAVCIGEGESALVELVKKMETGESIRDIPNFHIKEDGVIHKNKVRPLVQNLDELGYPDREIIYKNRIYRNNPIKVFMASRGCPGNCSYCFHSGWRELYAHGGNYFRLRSVNHVLSEIEQVRKRYPMELVHFTDDVFNHDPEWTDQFLFEYKKRIDMPFSAIFMVNDMDPKMYKKFANAGCVNIRIAFETASDRIKSEVLEKKSRYKEQLQAAAFIKEAGINLTTLNMLGVPGSRVEDDIETLKMNIKAGPAQALVNLTHPYPGARMSNDLRAMNLAIKPYDDFEISAMRTSPIDLPDRRETENLHRLFPLVTILPGLLPLAEKLIRFKHPAFHKLYTLVYGFSMEYFRAKIIGGARMRQNGKEGVVKELTRRILYRASVMFKTLIFSMRNRNLA